MPWWMLVVFMAWGFALGMATCVLVYEVRE